jgi:large subunit ribosomal protein L18
VSKTNPKLMRRIRHKRVRQKVIGTTSRPRLSIFRSLKHIYAQLIDDSVGQTLLSISTLDQQVKNRTDGVAKTKQAELAGTLLAEKALTQGISHVVFDRGGYIYHGRVRAFAQGARQAGLLF